VTSCVVQQMTTPQFSRRTHRHEGDHSPRCDASAGDAVSQEEASMTAVSPVEGEGEIHMSKVKNKSLTLCEKISSSDSSLFRVPPSESDMYVIGCAGNETGTWCGDECKSESDESDDEEEVSSTMFSRMQAGRVAFGYSTRTLCLAIRDPARPPRTFLGAHVAFLCASARTHEARRSVYTSATLPPRPHRR
jgi:hypothetical protein